MMAALNGACLPKKQKFVVQTEDLNEDQPGLGNPAFLFQFYHLGWVSGTGGGISIKVGEDIYIAPSGVQKERITGEDLFVQRMDGEILHSPHPSKNYRMSQCTPLFMNAYETRKAGAVIHTHSKWANLVTRMGEGEKKEFQIRDQEMIKGIKDQLTGLNLRYDQVLTVPIIQNTCFERDLKDSMRQAMEEYPSTCAVLVRNHGVYVWGDSWQEAKSMCECYDYLFEMACEIRRLGL